MVANGRAYCDWPGFGDSKGFEKDLVNCISIGQLLTKANSVRLITTVSYSAVTSLDGRGASVNQLLKTLTDVFENKTDQIVDYEALQKVLIAVTNAPIGEDPQNDQQYARLPRVKQAIYHQLVTNFMIPENIAMNIANNTYIVDPMDRIKTGQATRIEDFKQILNNQPPIEASNFKIPMTAAMMKNFADINNVVYTNIQECISRHDYDAAEEAILPLKRLCEFGVPFLETYIISHETLVVQARHAYETIMLKE